MFYEENQPSPGHCSLHVWISQWPWTPSAILWQKDLIQLLVLEWWIWIGIYWCLLFLSCFSLLYFFYLLAQAKKNSERRKGWVKCILNADGFFKRFLQISLKPGKCETYKQPCFVFVWGKKLLFSKRKLKKRILQIALFRTLEARLNLMPRKAL